MAKLSHDGCNLHRKIIEAKNFQTEILYLSSIMLADRQRLYTSNAKKKVLI